MINRKCVLTNAPLRLSPRPLSHILRKFITLYIFSCWRRMVAHYLSGHKQQARCRMVRAKRSPSRPLLRLLPLPNLNPSLLKKIIPTRIRRHNHPPLPLPKHYNLPHPIRKLHIFGKPNNLRAVLSKNRRLCHHIQIPIVATPIESPFATTPPNISLKTLVIHSCCCYKNQ